MTDLTNKNVLITGAASGLGKLLAQHCANDGANLILWDINAEGLNGLDKVLFGAASIRTYQVDLSSREMIEDVAEKVLADVGHIDVLVNNAGIVTGKSLLDSTPEQIQLTFDINALALFWTTRAFLPKMIERNDGHIMNVASAAGLVGTAKLVDYCSSKFAAVGFDEALRLEMQKQGYNIRTTVVCPYYINTGMFAGVKTRFSWLLPIMAPEYVAKKMHRALRKNKARVVLPPLVMLISPLRILPLRLFDLFMRLLGVSSTMDDFKGRK